MKERRRVVQRDDPFLYTTFPLRLAGLQALSRY
jgi:hypothetical protein